MGETLIWVLICAFKHRVAKWAEHLKKTKEPLEVMRRGKIDMVVLDKETFDLEEGERAFRGGRTLTHEQVGKRLARRRRSKKA